MTPPGDEWARGLMGGGWVPPQIREVSALSADFPASLWSARERSLGQHYEPDSLLFDKDLRETVHPADIQTFDSMHCLLSNGLVDNELTVFLPRLVRAGLPWASMAAVFAADWRFPKARWTTRSHLKELFNEQRRTRLFTNGKWSLDASTALAFVPIFGYLLVTVGIPIFTARGANLHAEIASFLALQGLVALVKEGKTSDGHARALRKAIARHLRIFKRAYPEEALKPKNHWMWHVLLQLLRDGWVLDCFVGERYNHSLKAALSNIRCTSNFEHSALKRILVSHVTSVTRADCFRNVVDRGERCEMLCGTHVAGRYVADTYVGASGRHDGVEVAAKDMILLADEVHQVHPGRPGADCPPRLSMFGRGGGIWRKVLAVMSLDGELAVLTHPACLVEQVCVFPNLELRATASVSPSGASSRRCGQHPCDAGNIALSR